jgi:hypothetical protein
MEIFLLFVHFFMAKQKQVILWVQVIFWAGFTLFYIFLFLQRLLYELCLLLGEVDTVSPRDLAAKADKLWAMHFHHHGAVATSPLRKSFLSLQCCTVILYRRLCSCCGNCTCPVSKLGTPVRPFIHVLPVANRG